MLYSLPRVIAFKLNRGPFQSGKKHKKESGVTKKIGHELNSEEIKAQTFVVDKKQRVDFFFFFFFTIMEHTKDQDFN